jgi:hypothetical protein
MYGERNASFLVISDPAARLRRSGIGKETLSGRGGNRSTATGSG